MVLISDSGVKIPAPIPKLGGEEGKKLGGEEGKKLVDFPYISQTQSQWCWAAVMLMIFAFNDTNSSEEQCSLSNKAFDKSSCCKSPSSSLCNKPLPVAQISSEWRAHGYNSAYKSGSLSFQEIILEIENSRAIEVGVKWSKGATGGHAILLTGWEKDTDGSEWVQIHDPNLEKGIVFIKFSKLLSNYGANVGRWLWSWSGIKE
ncbi:MAG: papain-like cysteine protease family protein [Cyanobacteria bacterium P01_D01_bin.56]